MKISVDDQELFTLSETQKRVIMHDIPEEIFKEDMKRRLRWVLEHKYEQCFKRLKEEYDPKLKSLGIESVPLSETAYAELVLSHPTYMSRSKRDELERLQRA